MDFKKAADIITSSSSSATPAKPAQTAAEVSAQKKSAIRFLSDSLFTSPPRDGVEYNKFVSGVFKLMYIAQSDSTADVCTVADECIARMIKALGPRHGEVFCYNLFCTLQTKKSAGATEVKRTKNAIVRLSEACKYIPASKEVLSGCIGVILETFVWCMSPEAALTYEKLFTRLVSDTAFPIRRYGSQCLAALCEKYPIPRHVRLVDSLLEEVSKDPASDSLKHGVLLFFLNAVKAKRPFLDDVDPMRKVLQKILRFSADNLSSSSHAIVSSSIDIVSQLLSDYPECDFLWAPSHAETWDLVTQKFVDLAFGDSGPRLSIRSAALGALGLLSRQRPVSTRACIVAKCTPFEVKLAELFQEHDQLFKDNLCAFLTGAIVGHLRLGLYDDLRSLLDVPAVMSRMIAIFEDPASMPGRPLCAALPDLINSFSGTSSPELHKCAEGVMAALLRTKPDRYWRVQVDVAKALGSVGYRSFCAAVPLQMSRSMQAQSLEFVLSLLGSRDSKVQTGAAEALVCMAGLLCTDPSEAALLLPRTDIWPTHSVASAGRGVEVVVQSLVQKTLQPNPRSQQKGVYRALRMLFARFARLLSGPENSPNPLGAYAVELMPLLLERLAGSVFSLDLECHVDMLALVGLLARGNRAYFGAYAEQALAHCLRLMDMITRITETKEPPPPSKDFSLGVEYISLLKGVAGLVGAYEKTAGYQKIYSKLYNTYMTTSGGGGSSSSNSNGLDKFSEMRPLVIRTVASVVGCMGPDALLKYKDELMYYLSLLYHHEPSSVLGCVGELFQALFTDELPATKLSLPRDREGLFATWGNLCSTETGRVPNANASKQALVTDFELFVRTAMKTYGTSTSGECKAAVLRFVTTLVKCGVAYDLIDKTGEFVETVIADCESVPTKQQQRQYFNDVKTVLPAVFELLHTLFNDKAHYTKALTGAVLVRLAKLSSVSLRSFTVKGVLAALRNVVPTLFSQTPGSAPTSVYYCRDQVLAITLKHFPEPPAVDVALRLLFEARVHNASWESLSKTVLPAALCLVGPSGLRCVKSFEDVWRMCSLWEAVSPAAVTAEKEAVRRQLFVEHRTSTLPKVGSGKSLMESVFGLNKVLCVLGVPWLVHFMTALRVTGKFKNEELFDVASKPDLAKFVLTNVMHVLIQASAPCLLFPDLRKCVVVVLRAAQKLIARVFTSSDSGVATDALVGFWETSGATLAPLAEALATTETLAAAELAAPLGRFLRTLFRSTKSDPTAPAALYAFYAKVLLHAKPSQSGCAFRPTETVVLREVALLLEEWEGAKDMQVDSVVLAKVFAAQQHIKTDINSLSAVLSSPLNAGAAAKAAAEGCLGAVVTHRGASNYILAVTQLPPNKEMVQTVITQLIPSCKSLSLQRCMCTIIHKSLPALGLSAEELNDLYALFEAATRVGESFSSYAGLRGLFEDLIAAASASSVAAPVPAALPAPSIEEGERSDGNGNGSRHLVAIKEADLTAYLVETKIKWSTHLTAEAVAPVLAALGPVVFAEVASTGRLDSLLPELVVSEVCASLRSAMAQYLKEQLVCLAALFSKTVAPSHEWSRAVTFCSCVAELAAQGRCAEFREVLAPEAQCELAAAVLGQFVRREGVAATESPSDLIAVFAFTSTALFGLVPPPLPRHPGDEESAAGNPLVSPLLRSIIEPLYEIYQNVVIAQSVQRFEPVKQLKQGVDNTEAKLLNLLAFLVISNATDSNSINTSFGPSFLRSFEALLLTLARLFPSLFYPIISNSSNPMSPLEIPLYDMCQGGNGTPEWTLRHVIRFITTVGVESDSFFQEVFGSLRAILTVPDPAALYISEELQCLALRGITAMILGVCYRDSQGAAQGHVPLHPVYAYHTGQAPSRFDPVHAALDAALAGIEGREWRTPAGTDPSRADRAAKFSYGQLPLSEIRQRPRKMRWQRLELTNAVAEVVYVIEALLHESDELKAFPDLGSERPDKQQQQQSKVIVFTQLQLEAVYSLVLLSDLLSDDHIAWMQDLFARFFGALAAPSTPDPVLMGNLAYGVLKCVAMTGASTPAAAKLVAYVVKYSLEAENAAISIGALAGMRLLLLLLLHHADAGTPKLLLLPPHLVGLATRHILAELGRPSPCSERSVLHLLASGFSLIRAFPSETELSGFSDGLVKAVCALVAVEDCSPVVSCAAYLGLSTLLAEASLPARTQGSLEAFALKALRALPPHAASSERGLTLLGILLSAVYHSPAARPAAELDKAIRALFGLARKGFFACRCVEAFVEGVARIVMDRLAPEVAVSLAVSELSKAKTSAWVTGLVVGRVFSLVEDRGVLATVTAASLRGILTCEAPYKVWMATCLLLAALPGEPPSPSASSASSSCSSSSSHYFSLLRATLCDTLASCKEDYALFAVAAAAFIESYPELTKEAKDNVVAALGHLGAKVPSYKMMISKLK